MIDDQPATSYKFANGDAAPTAIIDLGRERTLTRLSAVYAAQPGSVDFYVLPALPLGENTTSDVRQVANVGAGDLPTTLRISEKTFAGLKPVGSVVGTGEGRASVDFPQVAGRYLMLAWHPASLQGEAFSIAQVAAFGVSRHDSIAQGADAKDGKDFHDGKEAIGEGPEAIGEGDVPGEGPPPALPPVPPFTFIPQVLPTSP